MFLLPVLLPCHEPSEVVPCPLLVGMVWDSEELLVSAQITVVKDLTPEIKELRLRVDPESGAKAKRGRKLGPLVGRFLGQ